AEPGSRRWVATGHLEELAGLMSGVAVARSRRWAPGACEMAGLHRLSLWLRVARIDAWRVHSGSPFWRPDSHSACFRWLLRGAGLVIRSAAVPCPRGLPS